MSHLIKLFLILFITGNALGQWQWTELAEMPFSTSNNAVCEAVINGEEFVYSFGGIDTSKVYSGIHQRSFKYDVLNDLWSEIDSLPDASGKIASTASFVNGKIYIIGGYHVLESDQEISSNKIHIYNPFNESFESDGANIPIPIDDQVQCVYKDSLIYVVTGWSNLGNVPNVQIYNPSLNTWEAGTNTGGTAFYTSFGASGNIIGDTLYYYGGAGGGGFLAKKFMRKGYINPNDPTDITWSLMPDAPGLASYRSACSAVGNTIFWIGGSSVSYNYDGIAYNGSGGVSPSARVLSFNNTVNGYADEFPQPYGVMDLRGAAKLSNNRWVIAGGMDSTQTVNSRTFLIENNSLDLIEEDNKDFKVLNLENKIIIELSKSSPADLFDSMGRRIQNFEESNRIVIKKEDYISGVYKVRLNNSVVSIRL